jgi:hypothetical protein
LGCSLRRTPQHLYSVVERDERYTSRGTCSVCFEDDGMHQDQMDRASFHQGSTEEWSASIRCKPTHAILSSRAITPVVLVRRVSGTRMKNIDRGTVLVAGDKIRHGNETRPHSTLQGTETTQYTRNALDRGAGSGCRRQKALRLSLLISVHTNYCLILRCASLQFTKNDHTCNIRVHMLMKWRTG